VNRGLPLSVLVMAAVGAVVLSAMRCGTCVSSLCLRVRMAEGLIMANDRPLGFQAVSAVTDVSIGGFNASVGT
jgi:hypothetical protein